MKFFDDIRFSLFKGMIYLGLIALAVGLVKTQWVEGARYKQLSEQNRIRLVPLEAPRGRVLDRNGNLFATNRPSYDVMATPEDATPETFSLLAELLNLSEKEVRQRMSGRREYPFAPALIQEDISRELAFHIEERRPELPGVSIRVSFLRYYPYDETAAHLIGYIGKINQKEYRNSSRDRFGMNSFVGRAGIEKVFDDRLRGWRGGRQIEVNAKGQLMHVISEKNPVPGEDLTVTLDLEFQKKIMDLIKDKHASVAVLDLETDELIAMASTPTFNPNVFVEPGKSRERMGFLRDRDAPLLDRGVSSAYPPGSVFKLVTALAALETGKITPNTRFYCPGHFRLNAGSRAFKCWFKAGHGSLNLYEALERSCNVYFYNLGAKLSADQIAKYAREMGLGESLQLETASVTAGLVPDAGWKKEKYREKWYQGETLSFAIGQSYLLTSPLQILKLTAIIAKGGEAVEPHLLRETRPKEKKKLAIHKENLKVIKRSMLNVVQSQYGTGQLARVDFTKLAAKTGTAQAPPKDSHSWMTGFFPYKEPKIAFVVFVEHGGSGGVTGAGIVKDVLQTWGEFYAPKLG